MSLAKSLPSTPISGTPPGSPVYGTLPADINTSLEALKAVQDRMQKMIDSVDAPIGTTLSDWHTDAIIQLEENIAFDEQMLNQLSELMLPNVLGNVLAQYSSEVECKRINLKRLRLNVCCVKVYLVFNVLMFN